jgi:hypothetical protein
VSAQAASFSASARRLSRRAATTASPVNERAAAAYQAASSGLPGELVGGGLPGSAQAASSVLPGELVGSDVHDGGDALCP